MLSKVFRSDFEEQFVQFTNTPMDWALLLHFLQKRDCSNKFKVSRGNIAFSKVLIVWISLTRLYVFDCFITVAVVVVRYFPLNCLFEGTEDCKLHFHVKNLHVYSIW